LCFCATSRFSNKFSVISSQVKWNGYGHDWNTWEPEDSFDRPEITLRKFLSAAELAEIAIKRKEPAPKTDSSVRCQTI
jgi:hypothetical protein